ncbi:Sec-independent protein translocase protein TatB [Methylocella tundrae]|uniref:Sec-independent protein translocase protein TatB n=1 Tax=Methylocella tundrae TaxID=227605 RepID=A0A4U8YZB6_METTU|nr:Sec-independent protein translocase protein TatB [Methylocella tundrae]WPP05871.1 Sec-independent protein translocase protein TatB [Methylocella tundrae]VFU08397.1 Sec-independent protein translocase protein TatB [Methylocella tundrae]
MFDFDAGKLIIIGIVALIVIGPKELPRVLRQLGQAVGKMRRMAAEFQGQFMEAMREADMADVKADVEKLAQSAKVDIPFNPLADIKNELKGAIDGAAPAAKSSALPVADPAAAQALSPPGLPAASDGSGPALKELDLPVSPEGPHEGAGADQKGQEGSKAGIDAEMQALATALKAEIETAPRPEQPHAGQPHVEGDHSAAPLRRDPSLQDNA